MSSFKPRKVDSTSLFLTDHREEKKFWYLDPVVQPVVQVRSNGLFEDPDARVVVPQPLQAGPALFEANNVAGNVVAPAGVAGEVVEIRTVTLLSNAGGNYAMEDDGLAITGPVAVALGATEELLPVPIPLAGGSNVGIQNGLAADVWWARGVRLR